MANIFISYRRTDSAPYAGRLYDHLVTHFSEPQVFMDLEIKPGDDFVERLNEGVNECEVLLVLIGPTWLSATDDDGSRRLDDPADYARIEVAAALQRDIRVIPVMVAGAAMPKMPELPEILAPLGRRQAVEVSDLRFRTDTEALIAVIEDELGVHATARAEQERRAAEAERAEAERRATERAEAERTQATVRITGSPPGFHPDYVTAGDNDSIRVINDSETKVLVHQTTDGIVQEDDGIARGSEETAVVEGHGPLAVCTIEPGDHQDYRVQGYGNLKDEGIGERSRPGDLLILGSSPLTIYGPRQRLGQGRS